MPKYICKICGKEKEASDTPVCQECGSMMELSDKTFEDIDEEDLEE